MFEVFITRQCIPLCPLGCELCAPFDGLNMVGRAEQEQGELLDLQRASSREVDVAQWVDELTVLYTKIRLRHQRNKTASRPHGSFTSPEKLQPWPT
jgi:hypothetical protein